MSRVRKNSVLALMATVMALAIYCTFTRVELWPFSPFSMYAKINVVDNRYAIGPMIYLRFLTAEGVTEAPKIRPHLQWDDYRMQWPVRWLAAHSRQNEIADVVGEFLYDYQEHRRQALSASQGQTEERASLWPNYVKIRLYRMRAAPDSNVMIPTPGDPVLVEKQIQ